MAELRSPSSSSVSSPEALPRFARNRARCHPAGPIATSGVRRRGVVRRVSGGTWTIAGGGDNVWGTADEFQFAYRVMSGDVDISARLSSFDAANEWSKAGLMIRDGLTANGRNAFVALSPGVGAALQRRTSAGGDDDANGEWIGRCASMGAPRTTGQQLHRLPLDRWPLLDDDRDDNDQHACDDVRRPGGDEPRSRHSWQRRPSRTSRSVRHCQRRGGIATSEVRSGPAPQRPLRPGAFSVTGAGEAIWGNADQFQYVYQPIQGDTEIIARVASACRRRTPGPRRA